ncbi:hypothetical protein DES39_2053 [Orbus hercynius]|uniref:AsmA-like protein n=1 Tax=Orbus hercynius TaxID=593135 RepID=A0A495RAQ9_9GAMM|nr:hypothetical protein [Orbus hercynius]RKS84495.1 hypothetical protein DES39_2053 [Orbus hercynius]
MLKRLQLIILIIISILWFVVILPYLLVQTQLGSSYISQLLSFYDKHYSITIGHFSHNINKPYELILENVIIQDKSHSKTYLSADKMIVGLERGNLLQIHSFDYLIVENAQLQLTTPITDINVNILQLKNVSLSYQNDEHTTNITLNKISGSIMPWSSNFGDENINSKFNLTIQNAIYNGLKMQSILIQGSTPNNTIVLNTFGGEIGQGFFTVNGTIEADKTLNIKQLNTNNIAIQSIQGIQGLTADLPPTKIGQLSIINSSLQTPAISIEKGNIEARNIRYNQGWQLQDSDLAFNSESLVWHDELIEQPLLQWHHNDDGIVIDQAMAMWQQGNIQLTGHWQTDQLNIDSLIASGIRYILPSTWYAELTSLTLTHTLPANITIKQLMLMPSLLIDTNPKLPFQFSVLQGFANNIEIDSSKDNWYVNGTLYLKADSATLNGVEIDKPDLSFALTAGKATLTFSTLLDQGVFEGSAEMTSPTQLNALTINGHFVDSQILQRWYLITNPIQTNKYLLELHGNLEPLSLNGSFKTDEQIYTITNNRLVDY